MVRFNDGNTRYLSVLEAKRIQTFPDSWEFSGSESSQYKQIGNAVPVNLAKAMGHSLIRLLNDIEKVEKMGNSFLQDKNAKYVSSIAV